MEVILFYPGLQGTKFIPEEGRLNARDCFLSLYSPIWFLFPGSTLTKPYTPFLGKEPHKYRKGVSGTPMGGLGGVLGSWIQRGPVLSVVAIWRISLQDLSFASFKEVKTDKTKQKQKSQNNSR